MKSARFARVLVGLLAILGLLTAACGNDDDAPSAPPTDDGAEHKHDHATLMEVAYEPVPTIELNTHLDPKSGVNLEVITTGFTLAPQRASTDPVDGEGHFHIYVDGVKLRRLYAHWAHVDLKEPGDYEIRVELSANNHAALAVNGVKLDATAIVTIPGGEDSPEPTEEPTPTLAPTPEPTPELTLEPMVGASPTPDAGTTIELEVAGGKPVDGVQRYRIDAGDDVTIVVNGDTTDELHIHGYDLVVPFAPGQPGTITFEADIPGIFEVETHHHGDLVMELQVG